ncbi:unnamed protein product, partial [Prorocentrum cordatum]
AHRRYRFWNQPPGLSRSEGRPPPSLAPPLARAAGIQHSWMVKDPDLVWLDDKHEQVGRAAALLGGREVHMPTLAHAAAGDEAALAALKAAVRERRARNEPIVVKPRHGSNSKHVSLWPAPLDAGEAEVLASADSAMESWDDSWDRESWNQPTPCRAAASSSRCTRRWPPSWALGRRRAPCSPGRWSSRSRCSSARPWAGP